MTNALMSTPPKLAAGEPVRELDLAVSSGASRHRGMPFAAAPADRWDLTVRVVHASDSIGSIDPEFDAVIDKLKPLYPHTKAESKHLYGDDPAMCIITMALVALPKSQLLTVRSVDENLADAKEEMERFSA